MELDTTVSGDYIIAAGYKQNSITPSDAYFLIYTDYPPLGGPQACGVSQYKAAFISLYPNCVKHAFFVTYELLDPATVTIELYDVAGRKVFECLNKELPGCHKQKVEVDELNSGIYFVRFKVLNYAKTNKLIIVK